MRRNKCKAKRAVMCPGLYYLTKDPNIEKKEGTWTFSKGLLQQRIKYQRIKRNYQKLLETGGSQTWLKLKITWGALKK